MTNFKLKPALLKNLLTAFVLLAGISNCFSQEQGYYYDKNGTKIYGYVENAGEFILYRKTKKGTDQAISVANVKAFVACTDSFTVSHAPLLVKSPFLKVLIDNPLKLYYLTTFKSVAKKESLFSGSDKSAKQNRGYYYGKDPDDVKKLTKEEFIPVMSEIMSDKPEIVERIKDGTVKLREIDDWILFYKTDGHTVPASDCD